MPGFALLAVVLIALGVGQLTQPAASGAAPVTLRQTDSAAPRLQAETAAPVTAGLRPADDVPLRLIAFNDFHGNLRSPGALARPGVAGKVPVGGADALAGLVAQLRRGSPNALVVAAGDLIGASPLVSALFHDEPTVEIMNRLGLDATSVGNHEFDGGRQELLRKQRGGCLADPGRSCQGAQAGTPVPFEGAHYPILAANVIDQASGLPLLAPYAIRSIDGIPVGFIGLTLMGTSRIVSPDGIRGLSFRDEADTVNALVPELQRHGVHAIVVLIHQGGTQAPAADPASDTLNTCAGELQDDQISPIRALVRRFDDGVSLVISGHTHTAYNCQLPNRAGRLIPVTQALSYGRVVTRIDAVLEHATGRLQVRGVANLLVDRTDPAIVPDPAIAELTARYESLAAPLTARVLGAIAAPVPGDANAAGEMPAGDLLADAQLAATAAPELGGAQLALLNPGGVRTGFAGAAYPHPVSYGEAFTVQPFGNSLVVLELTAAQLKDVLEQQFPGCGGQTVQNIFQLSRGAHLEWSASAVPCAHVRAFSLAHDGAQDVLVRDGELIGPERLFRISVNSFLAGGGDSFTRLTTARNVSGGAQDLDALASYLAQFQSPATPYNPADPALALPRLIRIP
jgi:5'-nucleotidase